MPDAPPLQTGPAGDAAAPTDLLPDPAGPADGGESPDAGTAPDSHRPEAGEPYLLSQTGLYADLATRRPSPGLLAFQPTHALWSDGADKRRYLALPPGAQIDTSDPEHWLFPVGTRFWKEFSRGDVLLETRLIERVGPGPNDYWMGAFVWRADGSDAEYRPDGATSVNGTDHDVPSTKDCSACHGGERGRILGFSALQLAGPAPPRADPGPLPSPPAPPDVRLPDLAAAGLLAPPLPTLDFTVPGPPAAQEALGYLHANCGHCHSPSGLAFREVDLVLRLTLGDRTVEATGAYRTARNVAMKKASAGATLRLLPGQPGASGLTARMGLRTGRDQMPPLATKQVHAQGLEAVSRWIRELP